MIAVAVYAHPAMTWAEGEGQGTLQITLEADVAVLCAPSRTGVAADGCPLVERHGVDS